MTVDGAPLSVRGLTICLKRSKLPVVTDVGFDVPAGQVMGLVGESGSGKSTVGLALLGYVRQGLTITGGEVHLGDVSMLDLRGGALRRARGRLASYVPQDPASGLNPAMRLGAQLREAIAVHDGVLADGESVEDRAVRLLEEVGLPTTRTFQRSFPHQTSGGQQQRIGIAMAFACRPRLIVLDEPTTGLDVTTQKHVLDTVRMLTHSLGTTAVYVSHDLPVVAGLADATAVMYAGRIVEHAPADGLFTRPRHPYSRGLLDAAPTPDRATLLVGIEGRPPRPGQWPTGCTFADRCGRAERQCREKEPPLAPLDDAPDRRVRCLLPLQGYEATAGAVAVDGGERAEGRGDLVVSGLDAHYGDKQVLFDVELSVEPGRCLAVVGESGSGKTTLARCMVGLHGDWSGDARVDGQPLAPAAAHRTDEQRRLVQYIFQNPHTSLNPRMSVGENIGEPLRHFMKEGWRERQAKVLETLDLVALGRDFAERMPGQLSGGERQRVAVARALIVEPELLICDEITSALDVSVQALLVEQLRRLQRDRGLTALFITHNLSVVRSIAQDVIVLQRGHVVEHGTTEQVLSAPQHPYTRQLVADLPRLTPADAAA